MTATIQTVRDIATENPATVRVFKKYGIEYCCGGNVPLADAFAAKSLNVEEVVQGFLFDNLRHSQDPAILTRMFDSFERMATSGDMPVIDLLRIDILEPLVFRSDDYARAIPYMGPRTANFARVELEAS